MKIKFCIFFVLLFFHNTISFSQEKTDSIEHAMFLESIVSVKQYQEKHKEYLKLLKDAGVRFCLTNQRYISTGDEFLKYCFDYIDLHKLVFHQFLIDKYFCLNESQKEYVNARLSSSPLVLNESDAYFHELVSIYNLYRFSTFLNHHVYPGLTKKVELEFERKGRLSKETTFQLKSLATLINLGESQYEDSIVMMVNRIYRGAKEKGDRMMLLNLYGKILPYSLGKINTHSSIIKTIYLLDETTSGFFGDDFDNNFSFMYYLAVIYPKRDDKTIDLIDFETNKERIKKTTLNDNTIWWDYIKITE